MAAAEATTSVRATTLRGPGQQAETAGRDCIFPSSPQGRSWFAERRCPNTGHQQDGGALRDTLGVNRWRALSVRSRLANHLAHRVAHRPLQLILRLRRTVLSRKKSSYCASTAPTPSVRSYFVSSSLLRALALSFSFPPSSSYSKLGCWPPQPPAPLSKPFPSPSRAVNLAQTCPAFVEQSCDTIGCHSHLSTTRRER